MMMRTLSRLAIGFGLLASVTLVAAADQNYTVVLKDGSFVKAAERPMIEGDIALIRLSNGLLAHMETDRIDWKRSDDVSRRLEVLFGNKEKELKQAPTPVKQVSGTITMTGDDSARPAAAESRPAPPKGPDALTGEIQAQIENVDRILEELRYKKLQLEREVVDKKYNLDVVKSIRAEISETENKMRLAQQQRARLLRDLRPTP